MEAEKKKDRVLLNVATVEKLSSCVSNLPYAASKQKFWEVFRLAVNGGLDSSDVKLDTWDVALFFDQMLDLLQLLENIKGLKPLPVSGKGLQYDTFALQSWLLLISPPE